MSEEGTETLYEKKWAERAEKVRKEIDSSNHLAIVRQLYEEGNPIRTEDMLDLAYDTALERMGNPTSP